MKVIVNRSACVGHARCHHVAPELFALDDDGYIASTSFEVPAGQEALARRGVCACPERALSIVEHTGQTEARP
jgi:ferredoxin